MTTTTSAESRSVWGSTTDEFKAQFRAYMHELAQSDNSYRRALIESLEWCLDRWDYWRRRFFPETAAPMMFPFICSMKGGSEFAHYSVMGASGQPSVIHIRRDFLMGERDIMLTSWQKPEGTTYRLVLKKDHPRRWEVVDRVILHELVHQYLHEGADENTRRTYEGPECKKKGGYKGHGPLFCAEVNLINMILQPELGFEYLPMRHSKRSHARRGDELRVPCSEFGINDLFFAWDPAFIGPKGAQRCPLSPEQWYENDLRLKRGVEFFDGAVGLQSVAPKKPDDFPAPYADNCAQKCLQELQGRDGEPNGHLVQAFRLGVLRDLLKTDRLESALAEVGWGRRSSRALVNIPVDEQQNSSTVPPARDTNGNGHHRPRLAEVYPLTDPTSLERLLADAQAAGGKGRLAVERFGLKDGSSISRLLQKLTPA